MIPNKKSSAFKMESKSKLITTNITGMMKTELCLL